ncbi:hypothetical protein FQR65_LT03623 [Abscondita terminalis]|nr:hypothetical protein FQR65_LT03623 [Abscondita terminalis]
MASFEITNYIAELFPNKSLQTIREIVDMVKTSSPADSEEQQLENIVNCLMDCTNENENNIDDVYLLDDDEASGGSRVSETNLSQYFEQIMEIFTDACPSYVRNLCHEKAKQKINLDILINEMTSVAYPKKNVDVDQVTEQLKQLLPNAAPDYLEENASVLAHKSEADLKAFVEKAIEDHDYPTMEEYLINQKKINEANRYTIEFDIKEFIKQFPNPEQHFSDLKRKNPLTGTSENEDSANNELRNDELYALHFLYNHYRFLRKKDIERVFKMSKKSLINTCNRLDRIRKSLVVPRKHTDFEEVSKNIPLLQEIAYLDNRKAIKRIIKECDERYRLAKTDAKENGLLQTCACCFDEELIPEECYFCKNACIFCKECVKTGAETVISNGNLEFPCLADCGSEFSIPTLQMVLDSVVFSRMAQRKQMEEIKRANIDDLETCPFCEYATIPPPDSKIFKCLNEDCMKESCRECRHVAHIPLRCNEIEYDEDVKMRTYIENKMTEALLRACWKCNKVFIKTSGCNKMTCFCGAQMCYVCKQAVRDYTHFDQGGGTGQGRCPLYTQDLNKFHNDAVLRGAATAKIDLGVDKNPTKLKVDPTKGFNGN